MKRIFVVGLIVLLGFPLFAASIKLEKEIILKGLKDEELKAYLENYVPSHERSDKNYLIAYKQESKKNTQGKQRVPCALCKTIGSKLGKGNFKEHSFDTELRQRCEAHCE